MEGVRIRGAMVGGVMLVLLLLLLSPGAADSWSWSSKDFSDEAKPPAAQAAKEATKAAVRDVADAAKDTGESIKQTANAAYQTVTDSASAAADAAKSTVTGNKKDEPRTYRDATGKYVGDTVSAAQGKASGATGAVKDAAATAGDKVSQAAAATKDAAVNGAQSARDTAGRAYDATADTLGSVGNTVTDKVGSTKDRVWSGKSREDRKPAGVYDAAGNYYRSAKEMAARTGETVQAHASNAAETARDTAGRAYDSTAETLGSTKDRVWRRGDPEPTSSGGVYDAAGNYYNSAKEMMARTGETIQGHASYAGEKISGTAQAAADATQRAGQATRDSAANAYNSAAESLGYRESPNKGYGSAAYDTAGQYYGTARDTAGDYYDGAKNRLGSIIEILGWHRVPNQEVPTSKYFSPYDIMVGNTKYAWHQKPESESYYESAKNTIGGATQTVGQTLGSAGEYASDTAGRVRDGVYDAAGAVKDSAVDTSNRATEGIQDVTGRAKDTLWDTHKQTASSASEYSQKGKEVLGAGAAAIGLDKLGEKMERKGGFFRELIRFLHLVTFSVTFGSAVWMTFISGALLSKSIPREQFRAVQSKMFPFFLKFVAGGEVGLVLLYSIMSGSSKWQLFTLMLLAASTAFNAFALEPETTKLYFERLKLEKEEGRGLNEGDNVNEKLAEKKKKFNEVHGFSTTLNLISLVGLTLHALHLARRMH